MSLTGVSVSSISPLRVCACTLIRHAHLSLSLPVCHFNFKCVFRCVALSLDKILCIWIVFCPSRSLLSTQAEHLTQPVSLMAITVPSYLSLSLCMCMSTHEQQPLAVTCLCAPYLSARPSPDLPAYRPCISLQHTLLGKASGFSVIIETRYEKHVVLANGAPFQSKTLTKLLLNIRLSPFVHYATL